MDSGLFCALLLRFSRQDHTLLLCFASSLAGLRSDTAFFFSPQSPYLDLQIELIEVAPFPKSVMRRSVDDDMCSRDVGTYHISVDASCATLSLRSLLFSWNDASKARFGKSLTIVTPPEMLSIGGGSVEAAMIQDADGNIVEIMRRAWEVDAVGGRGEEKVFEWEDDGVFREDATV